MLSLLSLLLIAGPSHGRVADINPRADVSAYVDLSVNNGAPQHLASGFIYGIPDKANQVPDHWYTDMGFNYGRAGGAQLGSPARGWIWGRTDYNGRFQSTLSNYQTTRKYGGKFIILPHDIWGTDGANSSTVWPGDNGNWNDYDAFIKQLMADLKSNNALNGLVFDIWNEPDISIFWKRSTQQWVDLYTRTHQAIRADSSFNNVQITGPSLANTPSSSNTWWTTWLSAIKSQNTIPDQYSYHLEGSTTDANNDLQNSGPALSSLLSTYGLPSRLTNINEYANSAEQIPAGAAWWISRLERYNAVGLRGNWLSGTELHDLFANLLTKTNNPAVYTATDYVAAPEYEVYKYYNLNMTGHRVKTTGSSDRVFDVYATVGGGKVRILSGARHASGTWAITVQNLSSVGLATSGTISITTYGFKGTSVWDKATAPQLINVVSHDYSGNTLNFPIYQTDTTTSWAFEFSAPNAN